MQPGTAIARICTSKRTKKNDFAAKIRSSSGNSRIKATVTRRPWRLPRSCGILPRVTIWSIFLAAVVAPRGGVLRRIYSASKAKRPQRQRGTTTGAGSSARGSRSRWGAPREQRTGASRQHSGDHRGSHPGSRGRIPVAAHGGHRRSGPVRPAASRDRSARAGSSRFAGQGQPAAGARGARRGAGQLRARQIQHGIARASLRSAGAVWPPAARCRGRRTTSTSPNLGRKRPTLQVARKGHRRAAQHCRRRRSQPGAPRQNAGLSAW